MITAQPAPTRTPLVGPDGYVTAPWSAFFDRFYLQSQGLLPSGMIAEFAGTVAPEGWRFCNGDTLQVENFPVLFSAIGVKYGGSGGTFKLPDRRGKFARGAVNTANPGGTGGNETYTLILANLPPVDLEVTDPGHNHVFEGIPHTHNVLDPGHNHAGLDGASFFVDGGTDTVNAGGLVTYDKAIVTGDAETGLTIQVATAGGNISVEETGITVKLLGESVPFSIIPPYLELNYIIKL